MNADRLTGFDFARHNADVRQLWAEWGQGRPHRTPIIFGTNTRFFMFNPEANPTGLSFQEFTENPDVMFDALLRFQRWSVCNLLQDRELGLPERWTITPDFQNYYEAAWFGCRVHYFPDQVPDTMPEFADDPESLVARGVPEPFGGFGAKVIEYIDHFRARAKRETYLDRPINIGVPMCGTDGPFTVACNLLGPAFVCEAMAGEPERYHRLLDFITNATITRMTAWRKYAGLPIPQDGFYLADDSIAMISTPMYIEHVLPYHRRMCDALATAKPRLIHLCGDATRHFLTLRDELNIRTFDTGYPVNFEKIRGELGPDVGILGGPRVEFLRTAKPAAVRDEVRRIMNSGIRSGNGMFVLRDANNLAPYTPLENTDALYHAGRELAQLPPR